MMSGLSALMLVFVTLVTQTQVRAQTTTGPTAASASSTDEAINQALLTGNADALKALLADDWIVVSGFGSVADKHGFIDFIQKSGARKKMILWNRGFGFTERPTCWCGRMAAGNRYCCTRP